MTSDFVDAVSRDGYVEGYAVAAQERGWPAYFKVPLFTHIDDLIWIGGTPADSTNRKCLVLPDGTPRFGAILNVAPYWHYDVPEGVVYREAALYDSADGVPDADEWLDLAMWVKQQSAMQRTLVHCQAGLNRSSLIVAGALMIGGMSADKAIETIRERRDKLCLCNESFENFLRGVEI